MHALQTLHGFEVQAIAAHGQVISLHQAQAQVAGQIGVLEIGFVVGAGCEQRNVWRLACRQRTAGFEAIDQGLIGTGQALH